MANSIAVILKKSVWSDSECLGNSNSVQRRMIRNCHSVILQSPKVKLVKSFAAINFVRPQYSRSQLMEHQKEISQKPRIRLFGADSLKRIFQVSFTKLHVCKRTYLTVALIQHLTGIFKALFRCGSAKLHPRSLLLI